MLPLSLLTAWAFGSSDPFGCKQKFGHLQLPFTRLATAVDKDTALAAKVWELTESEDIPLSLKKTAYDALERQRTTVFRVEGEVSGKVSGRYFYNR